MDNQRENQFNGITDVGQADDLLSQFMRDYPAETSGAADMLADILEALRNNEEENLTGTATDFHNFSVRITKITNNNRDAFYIVKEGLKIHEANTDLLADALRYGSNCGEKEECNKYYEQLMALDRTHWTWRGFSFLIDYMLEKYASGEGENIAIEDILKICEDYKKIKPDEEDAWLSEQEIYETINQPEQGIKVLKEAIEKFEFCPKCWLRYADIMMDKGKYEEAEPIIRKLKSYPKSGEDVNIGYMYYLDGICQMTKFKHTEEYENGEIDETEVRKIYRSFRLALASSDIAENTKNKITEYIKLFAMETDVEYPYY